MFLWRALKKGGSTRSPSIIHLVFCVFFVSLSIYIWKISGCLGFPECYLCQAYSSDCFLNPGVVNPPESDFTRLMDLKNFSFLMNNIVCNHSDLVLLVLVHSEPNNVEKRLTIRSTWGRFMSEKFKLLFLLGIPNGTAVQQKLDEENRANRDLVQGNFVDTYRNLTYKHVMALKWTKYFCPNAKYLLKTDDDVFINLPGFLKYIDQDFGPLPRTNLMRCLPVYGGRAKRSSRSKWRVTWSEYKFRGYPTYCQGLAILYSPDVVMTLYEMAQVANYFWIDDVFITGLLGASANYTPSTFGRFVLDHEHFYRLINEEVDIFTYLLGPWNLKVEDIRKLWQKAFRAEYIRVTDLRS